MDMAEGSLVDAEAADLALDIALARRAVADGDSEASAYAHSSNSGPVRFEPREK